MNRRRFLDLTARTAAAAALAPWAGCAGDRPRPSIVLVVIDTLRADRVSPDVMPNLTALAGGGTWYRRAVAAAPWTFPSCVAILTGQHPDALGVSSEASILQHDHENLAQRLAGAGYTTLGVLANPWLAPGNGLDTGFAVWDDAARDGEAPAATALERARRHLKAAGGDPCFLYVHLNDAHWPFVARPRWNRDPGYSGPIVSGHDYDDLVRNRSRWSARDLAHLAALYDSEVSYVDHELGRFLAGLEEDGRLDGTLVLVTSDHGEEFGERGWIGHGWTLHRELLDVPLVLRWPDGRRRAAGPAASHVDIAPTLAAAAGAGPFGADGTDLAAGDSLPWRFSRTVRRAFARRHRDAPVDLASLTDGVRKVILDRADHGYAFFDLAHDPDERAPRRHPAGEQDKALVVALEKTLESLDRRATVSAPPENREIEASVRARLRSLGYL